MGVGVVVSPLASTLEVAICTAAVEPMRSTRRAIAAGKS
jgi:hypothetical protein